MKENRIAYLRDITLNGKNHSARIPFKNFNDIREEEGSLPLRKAKAVAWMYDNSPVCIGEKELIVGTRTLLAANAGNEDGHDTADYSVGCAMPSYVSEADVKAFGFNEENLTKTHYTPDYGIVLQKGISGIISYAKERLQETENVLKELEANYSEAKLVKSCYQETKNTGLPHKILCRVRSLNNEIEFLKSVIISWEGISRFILRYAAEANRLAKEQEDAVRKQELLTIANICNNISRERPTNFHEAVQLFWFAHLCVLIESQLFINYGRVDVLLHPFLKDTPRDKAKELLACLLMKFYDQADLKYSYLSRYGGQITMTLGGVDEKGENTVSETTFLILDALSEVRLTEPLVSFKINSKNPPEFLQKACELSQSGLNTIGFYNDDLFIDSLKGRDIPEHLANTYSFGLCQDVTVAGYDDNSMSCSIDPLFHLFRYLHNGKEPGTFEELFEDFKLACADEIDCSINSFNRTKKAFLAFRDGDREQYFDKLAKGEISRNLNCRSLMCPLPVLSALFHGCIETATDITLGGCELKTHGYYIFTPTVTVNSLVAIKYAVFDKKICTYNELLQTLESNFAGEDGEILRQRLFHAPKWGNNDDYADSICVPFLEFCLKQVQKHDTAGGGKMLAGIHQPHPVLIGKGLKATPDGRNAGDPISVTLTPSNGTLRNGPLAALLSAAKFDHKLINWNFCIMLNYSASVFKEDDTLLSRLISTYFEKGGMQHQPNICHVEDLINAQKHPEEYPDLIVRLWGVSVRFIDISRELQDEVIERFA